jgi:hypothetical protein
MPGDKVMRAKEIINKKIIQPIRSVGKSMPLPKLFSIGLVSLLSALPLISLPNSGTMVYAQLEQQAQTIDPWSEALRVAQSKVEAATSPGAFGHGVPDLHNLTPQDLLLLLGVAAIGSILVYVIANHLLNRSRENTTKSDQLITSHA